MDGYMDKMIRKKGRREAEKNEFTCFPQCELWAGGGAEG
jgi:hypothetical protein